MSIVKIKNDSDFEAALKRLDEIFSAQPGDDAWEERCALIDEIEKYEDRTVEIPPPNPIDAINFRMEQGGLRSKDLIPFIGSASKVSEVLAGKRTLSKEMIRKLHEGLGIPLKSLMGIQDNIPPGFVQVDWVLPATVVDSLGRTASLLDTTEESLAAKMLMVTISVLEENKDLITMTEQRQEPKSPNATVVVQHVRPDLAA